MAERAAEVSTIGLVSSVVALWFRYGDQPNERIVCLNKYSPVQCSL